MRLAIPILAVLVLRPGAAACEGSPVDRKGPPVSAAEKRAVEWLDAVNSGDPASVKALVEEAMSDGMRQSASLADHRRILAEIVARHGRLALHGFRPPASDVASTTAVAIVRAELSEAWLAIVIEIEAGGSRRIAGVRLQPAHPPSDVPAPPPLSRADALAALDAQVDRLARAGAFTGTIAVAQAGTTVYARAAGSTALGPVTLDTRLTLGSLNEMLTAVAIAQLVEAGKLSVSDPVSRWLGGSWLPRKVADRIRIEHLLTHSSGLGSRCESDRKHVPTTRCGSLDDWKPFVAGMRLEFEPGASWSYSNVGYVLLGAIVEKASGKAYVDYVRDHVQAAAGMTRTSCCEGEPFPDDSGNVRTGEARPVARAGSYWERRMQMHLVRGGPAGSACSTTADLLALAVALQSGRLVSRDGLARMTSAKPELSAPGYGYGFALDATPGHRVAGHVRNYPGITGVLEMYLDDGWSVAVLATDERGAELVGGQVRDLLLRTVPGT